MTSAPQPPSCPQVHISHSCWYNLLHDSDDSLQFKFLNTIDRVSGTDTKMGGADVGREGFMRCSNKEVEDPDCTIKNSQFEKLRRKSKKTRLSGNSQTKIARV